MFSKGREQQQSSNPAHTVVAHRDRPEPPPTHTHTRPFEGTIMNKKWTLKWLLTLGPPAALRLFQMEAAIHFSVQWCENSQTQHSTAACAGWISTQQQHNSLFKANSKKVSLQECVLCLSPAACDLLMLGLGSDNKPCTLSAKNGDFFNMTPGGKSASAAV